MLEKTSLILCLSLLIFSPVSKSFGAEKSQIVFIEPDVAKEMHNLNWGLPKLKEWRRHPTEKVNSGLDGKFNLTVKLLNIQKKLIGETPRLKICPMPNEPNSCWEQDVLTPSIKREFSNVMFICG
jgi:hypothetical protein